MNLVLLIHALGLLLGLQSPHNSSYKMEEGMLLYDVSLSCSKDSYLSGTTLRKQVRVIFNESFIKYEQLGDPPNHFSITNRNTGEKREFVDFFGHHYEIVNSNQKNIKVQPTILTENKKMAGFECKKAIISHRGKSSEAWVTKDIALHFPSHLNGCALEFSIPNSHGEKTYKLKQAYRYSPSVNSFQIYGYEPISEEEFKKKFRGK